MININVSNNIKLNGLPKETYHRLVQRLTHLNPNYENAMRYSKNKYKAKRIPKTIKAYQYDKQKKQLIIPRGFYLELRNILDEENLEYRVIEDFPNYERIDTETNIELRPYQQEMINDLECYYGYNCIAKAPPGAGKTLLGLEFARKLGYKTLWLAHNDRLFKQAIESGCRVFNCTPDDVGIIRGKELVIDKQIVVGMFQTINRKDIVGLGLNDKFGTIIVDEAHHSPANTWSYIINCFNPYLVLGLTATPRRGDGLTQLLFDYMGPIVATASKERLFEAGFAVPVEYHTLYSDIHTYGDNFKQIETHMIGIPERNELLFKIIQQEYGEQDNYIVLLTSRRDHVTTMHEMCLERRIPALKLLGGKLKKAEEARIEQELNSHRCRVLIATYSYLSEGFDYPPLSTVIFGTPFRDDVRLEQSVGRAQRFTKTKTYAKIIDITDDNGMLKSQSRDRLEYAELLELDKRKYELAL